MGSEIDYQRIKSYFAAKLDAFGATPQGVDWNSESVQTLRFEQLIKICTADRDFSINDYGCGYGALIEYMEARGFQFQYTGFDLAETMIAKAKEVYQDRQNCSFTSRETDLQEADYTVASGIFNVCFDTPYDNWTQYVTSILHKMNGISRGGFAFNMLSKYSEIVRMHPDLYYADPGYLFDYCKTHFSRNVALLHDYELYDFTVLVRKEADFS